MIFYEYVKNKKINTRKKKPTEEELTYTAKYMFALTIGDQRQ